MASMQPAMQLRPFQPQDAPALADAVRGSLGSLRRWLPWTREDYGLAQASAWITHVLAARDQETEYAFGAFDPATGALMGVAGLNRLDTINRNANLGYWSASAYQGRGVATAAARDVARFGLRERGLVRVEIVAAMDNHASRRVAEKIGATAEAIARNRLSVHGIAQAAMVYSLVPEDFPDASVSCACRGSAA